MQLSTNRDEIMSLAFNYVNGPVSARSTAVFSRLIEPITHGKVLDLGCGANAYFWALGYAERVRSITFADRDAAFVHALQQTLATLSRNDSPDIAPVMHHLREVELITEQSTQRSICSQILDKANFVEYDFTGSEDFVETDFDFVLSLGSIGCVNSQDQLVTLFKRIENLLAPGGMLHAIWTPYRERDDLATAFITAGIDGSLNPNLSALQSAIATTGLEVLTMEQQAASQSDGFYSNYLEPIFIVCRRRAA